MQTHFSESELSQLAQEAAHKQPEDYDVHYSYLLRYAEELLLAEKHVMLELLPSDSSLLPEELAPGPKAASTVQNLTEMAQKLYKVDEKDFSKEELEQKVSQLARLLSHLPFVQIDGNSTVQLLNPRSISRSA